MKNYLVVLFCFISILTQAHPGTGIVKDKKGNIFYSDLAQVWKISPDGRKTVAVPNVHTHELYMDSADNLYGEHLWYNGDRLNTWGHYVWKLKSNGRIEKILGPKPGFLEQYSFVRDEAGNMYWVERWQISRIKKKSPNGRISTLAEGKWGEIRWMYATPGGSVYFTNWHNLYKMDRTGSVSVLATDINNNNNQHDLYGIWSDKQENIYIAIMGSKMIKKITPQGSVSVVLQNAGNWTPTGGVFDNNGNLWVLENSNTNEVRVRKVEKK